MPVVKENLCMHMRNSAPRTWTTLCQKIRKCSKTFLTCAWEKQTMNHIRM